MRRGGRAHETRRFPARLSTQALTGTSETPSSTVIDTIRSTSSGRVRQFTIAGAERHLAAETVVPK